MILATFTWVDYPGGAFDPRQSFFYMVGKEGDRLRIYDQATAPWGVP